MTYKLLIANQKLWLKDISKIDVKQLKKILNVIEQLKTEPWSNGVQVKKLQSFKLANFRLRVGQYRILFDRNLETGEVVLYRVLHRSKLY